MIDHVSVAVADLKASTAFYEGVLAPLGLNLFIAGDDRAGFGKKYPEFWINLREGFAKTADDTGIHICLRARSIAAVDAFHAAALAGGGRCDGPPGERQAAITKYYGAFIRGLDGNKLEAVTFLEAAV